MASNDKVLLDILLQQGKNSVAADLTNEKYFEIFVSEQILKDFDLSYEELENGIVAGGNDGGIDSIHIFLNGELVSEDTDLERVGRNPDLLLIISQAKTANGFGEDAIHRLDSSNKQLFDLSIDLNGLRSLFSPKLIAKVQTFRQVYSQLVSKFPKLQIRYYYATKGNDIHPNTQRRKEGLLQSMRGLFSDCDVSFTFLTASDLLGLARRAPKTSFNFNIIENSRIIYDIR